MENLEQNDLRMDLLKRSIRILEYTKIDFKEYHSARLILLAFTQDKSPNYELWEHLIRVFEDIISLEEKIRIKEENKITRTVDELGRIVIPLKIRDELRNL